MNTDIIRHLLSTYLVLISLSLFSQQFKDVTSTHLDTNGLDNNTMDAHVIDVDNDGDLDLVLAIEYRENILLINNGEGKFSNESNDRFPRARHDSEDIAIADFDDDGDPDIVFVSEDDKINEYYENLGNGKFTDSSARIPVSGTSNSVEAIDINHDGAVDLLIGNAGQNHLLINDGKGYFNDETRTRLPNSSATTQDVEFADIDNDGDLDIIEANETDNVILINDGNGYFDNQAERLPAYTDQTREVDLADIDNDGDLDIFFSNVDFGGFGNPQNRLLINDGKGFFKDITDQALPKSSYRTVDSNFIDINNDGYVDILSGNRFNGNNKLVLINTGRLTFIDKTKEFLPDLNMYVFDFQVADFNGDGINDIYLCGFRGMDKLLFGVKD